jgi:hypothetical protein
VLYIESDIVFKRCDKLGIHHPGCERRPIERKKKKETSKSREPAHLRALKTGWRSG